MKKNSVILLATGCALLLGLPQAARAQEFTYGLCGFVQEKTGAPLNGPKTFTFRLCDLPSDGNCIFEETQTLDVDEGNFCVSLGFVEQLPEPTEGYNYVEMHLEGEVFERFEIVAVPRARYADYAETCLSIPAEVTFASGVITTTAVADAAVTSSKIATGAVTSTQLSATGVTAGTYTNATVTVGADGRLTAASNGAGGSGGDVTGVTAGPGLTGGGASGDLTLSLNQAVTPTWTGAHTFNNDVTIGDNLAVGGTLFRVDGNLSSNTAVSIDGSGVTTGEALSIITGTNLTTGTALQVVYDRTNMGVGENIFEIIDLDGANPTTTRFAVDKDGQVSVNGTFLGDAADFNGQVSVGDGGDTVAIDSSDWDVSTAGAATGLDSITNCGDFALTTNAGCGTSTISLQGSSGVDLNNGVNANTNINTGTSTGAVAIGGGNGTVAVNSSDWDISATGAMSGIDSIAVAQSGIEPAGLLLDLTFNSNSGNENSMDYLLSLTKDATSVVSPGIGTGITFNIADVNLNADQSASLDVLLTNANDGGEDADMVFNLRTNGTMREVMRYFGDTERFQIRHPGPALITPNVLEIQGNTPDGAVVSDILTLTNQTMASSEAAGLGVGLTFQIEDNGGTEEQASLDVIMTDVFNGNERVDMAFNLNRMGTITEIMRVSSSMNAGTSGPAGLSVGDSSPDGNLAEFSTAASDAYDAALAITTLDGGGFYDPLIKFEIGDNTPLFTMGVDNSDNDQFKIGTSSLTTNTAMTINSSGEVGMGANPGGPRLTVQSSAGMAASFERPNDGVIIGLRVNGNEEGNISSAAGTVSYNAFTGSHYAMPEAPIEKGMLATLTGRNSYLHQNPKSELIYGIRPSAEPNDPAIFGVYLDLLESGKPAGHDNPHLVMAVGNGTAWVVDMGQDLKPGDNLISSHISGHAMADDGRFPTSHVFAKVAEPVDWDSVEETVDDAGIRRKRKLVSIVFANFDKENLEPLRRTIEELRAEIEALKARCGY